MFDPSKLTNRGCICENYTWNGRHEPVEGHHPACPSHARCRVCRRVLKTFNCDTLVCRHPLYQKRTNPV